MQATFLRDLNRRGDAEAVIRHFEGGRIISSEATLGEYVKALARADKLDNTSLLRTLQVELTANDAVTVPVKCLQRAEYHVQRLKALSSTCLCNDSSLSYFLESCGTRQRPSSSSLVLGGVSGLTELLAAGLCSKACSRMWAAVLLPAGTQPMLLETRPGQSWAAPPNLPAAPWGG